MKNSTRGAVDPFIVMDVMEQARAAEAQGRRIVHMEVGQPGTPAPLGAREAVARAMEGAPLGYTVALGLPELRARIARLYGEWHGVDLSPDRVVVTAGSSAAFVLAFSALFDAGDRVGIGAPGYPSYRQILRALSLEPVVIPTGPESRYQLCPAHITQTAPRLDGVLVASPANPTGTMLDRSSLEALTEAARGQGTAFISDEIYHGIGYERPPVSVLSLCDDAIVINSFSKYFSMTGWRIGWMVVPESHVRPMERLMQNMFICAPHVSQIAALAALDCEEELRANVDIYARNRALMVEGLRVAGFTTLAPPDGAFFIYADVSAFTSDSRAFAAEILREAGVAVTPGVDFDAERGHHFLRFSYAQTSAEIEEGLARLKAFMQGRADV